MFSKYDVYSSVQSIYCYKNTNVLKNRLSIKNQDVLRSFEEEVVSVKAFELIKKPFKGNFTKTHFFNIHKFLFIDVYPFAGKIRKEQIWKGDTMFYPPNSINEELDKLFSVIRKIKHQNHTKEELLDKSAYIMTELNIIHPFREGNGRAIREFIRQWFEYFGYSFNWGLVDKQVILDSSIKSVDDYSVLIDVLEDCIN